MATLDIHLGSESLEMQTQVVVTMPDAAPPAGGFPVLHLLHGYSDDASCWTRFTGIERYAERNGVAVVMPSAGHSFYTDEAHGQAWWTWVADELPRRLAGMLGLSTARERTFVAGLSMGGYGAMKLALRHPDRFAAAASMSGSLDFARRAAGDTSPGRVTIFGDADPTDTPDDLIHLLETADPSTLPRLHVSCGTEDFLRDENRAFLDAAAARGIPVTTDLRPGDHDWDFWDAEIRTVLDWLDA